LPSPLRPPRSFPVVPFVPRPAARGGVVAFFFRPPPPLLAVMGWFVTALGLRRFRYGIWSMDLHPDAEIAAGMVRPTSAIGRMLIWLDEHAFRRAAFVVDLGPYMKRRIVAKGVHPSLTHSIAVWGDTESAGGRPSL